MSDLVKSVSECYPSVPSSLSLARRAVLAVAGEAGATGEQMNEIRLALSEALTNAILHAYGEGPGEIHVTAAAADGELWVLVADEGSGLRSRSDRSGLGLGLALIAQATDELTIVNRSSGGTELRMRFRLGAGPTQIGDQSRGSVASSVFSTTR